MIVADTNIVAYLLIGGDQTPAARAALLRDCTWVAPRLWRSEFRNVLAMYMQNGRLTLAQANHLMAEAEGLLGRTDFDVGGQDVLRLASLSRCTAYDCEYIALAQRLRIPLVTSDAQLLRAFPAVAVSLAAFARG